MKTRLVAYRRQSTGSGTYDLDQFELDLQEEPNVVVNYNWIDLKDPSQRKSSFSQTLKLPFSNANNKFFENYFDVNLDTLVFNAKFKFPAIMYIDSIPQLKGYIQLKSIYLNARLYEVALFGDTADFFTDLKDAKLKDVFNTQDTTDPNLLLLNQILDHKLTLANVLASWTTGLTTVLGATSNDIMYPIFDYGHTYNPYSSAMFWNPDDWIGDVNELGQVNGIAALNYYGMVKIGNLKPAIRIQRLLQLIAAKSGYTIESTFLGISGDTLTDTDWFSRIFMTLSTENQMVQTVFNTSSGSESPFIGFEVNMSASASDTVYLSNAFGLADTFIHNVNPTNELYDPNGLISTALLDTLVVEGGVADPVTCPIISFPIEPDDQALLPSGSMQIETTLELTLPATLGSGASYDTVLNCYWYKQSTLNDETFNVEGFMYINFIPYESLTSLPLIPGTTSEYNFTNSIPVEAGETFFCVFQIGDVALSTGAENLNFTIENCTIKTIQTDEVGLMGGGENGIVQMRHNMPDITQADFVKDLINKFNLIIKTDEDDEKKLLIEPYDDFVSAGTTNYWTDKLDLSKEQVVKTTNELQSKLLKFGDLEDEDFLNKRYNEKYNIVYGTYKEKRDNDFASESFENFSATSPLIAQGMSFWSVNGIGTPMPEGQLATAYLFDAPEGEASKPLESMKPKLFYYSGTPVDVTGNNPNGSAYSFNIYSNQYLQTSDKIDTGNKFPLCTQYNLDNLNTGVTSSTKILHWTYYNPNFNTGLTFNYFGNTYSEHGFYYDYWVKYINEIYSDEARMMECYVNLSPTDIQSFAGNGFQNTYFIKNCLWRVISIDNYLVGGNKSTKVTLLKVVEKIKSTCDAIPTINGLTGEMTWVDASTGLATTITNSCCEEQNENWTFVQTNATTGVGQCYATGGDGTTTVTSTPYANMLGGNSSIPSMLPNITSNNLIQSSTGYAQTMNFVLEATTNGTETTTFNFGGMLKKVFQIKFLTVSFIKIKLLGTVKNGTNFQKVGYFEYDTVLGIYYGGLQNIGGTTLLKTKKDAAFTTPTLDITNSDGKGYWQPTITGGAANEVCNWICEVSVISKSQGMFNANTTKAIYQNSENILFQNLDYLIWN